MEKNSPLSTYLPPRHTIGRGKASLHLISGHIVVLHSKLRIQRKYIF